MGVPRNSRWKRKPETRPDEILDAGREALLGRAVPAKPTASKRAPKNAAMSARH